MLLHWCVSWDFYIQYKTLELNMRCDIILSFFFFWTQHDRFSSLIHGDLVCKHLCEERKLRVLFNNSFGFTCGTMASSAWVCSWDPSPIFNYLLLIRNWIFYLCRGKSWPEGRLSCQSSFFSVGLAVCIRTLYFLWMCDQGVLMALRVQETHACGLGWQGYFTEGCYPQNSLPHQSHGCQNSRLKGFILFIV